MKKYFLQYKPFLFFLSSFFGAYIVLTILYQYYLNGFVNGNVDTITTLVAQNTKTVLSWVDQSTQVVGSDGGSFFTIFFKNKSVAQIVEGCNGISVIILFVSFIVAFSGNLKNTLLFIFGGSLVIYILNVLRIAVLTVGVYYFPEQLHILHGVLFPLMIYGVVLVLWVIWVNKFSKYAK
jgi:exosortase family protein XrtF